jgi:hypothetical protein
MFRDTRKANQKLKSVREEIYAFNHTMMFLMFRIKATQKK